MGVDRRAGDCSGAPGDWDGHGWAVRDAACFEPRSAMSQLIQTLDYACPRERRRFVVPVFVQLVFTAIIIWGMLFIFIVALYYGLHCWKRLLG